MENDAKEKCGKDRRNRADDSATKHIIFMLQHGMDTH